VFLHVYNFLLLEYMNIKELQIFFKERFYIISHIFNFSKIKRLDSQKVYYINISFALKYQVDTKKIYYSFRMNSDNISESRRCHN